MSPSGRDVYRWIPGGLGILLIAAGIVINRPPPVAQAQGQSQSIPRLGAKPNFSGVWQTLNEANWDLEPHAARAARVLNPGVPNGNPVPEAPVLALGASGGVPASLGVVEGGTIPYKPDALKKRNENAAHTLERDPEVKCLMPGVPRATYLPFPFQITQSDTKVMMSYGYSNTGRTIHFDKVESPGYPTWMGFSAGRWDGDTLVVDVTELNENTWFDRAGNHHSDNLHVVERYTMTSPNHILYEATIEDPTVFTRPWKIKMPLYRRLEDRARVLEYRCVEMAEELIYGHLRKTQLVKHWEGDYGRRGGTLVIDVTRKPTKEEDQ